jgi:predicted nucleotidyltransferase
MTSHEVLQKLSAHRSVLLEHGVKSLRLFGSVARGEATDQSDVDLLVEFSRPTGLFGLVRLRRYLEELLGCRVDLTTPGALRDSMRERILSEAIDAA